MLKFPEAAIPADFLDSLDNEGVIRRKLENGLTVLYKPMCEHELVSVQYWVKTGSINEGDYLGCGLSHFLEHMLFKGTAKRGAGQIAKEVHSLGGQINAYTTFDRTVYLIDGASDTFSGLVDILTDAVFHSELPADEIEMERKVILREISMGNDSPDQELGKRLFSTAFQEHPFKYPVIGHRELFETVTREELSEYYQGRYSPDNTVLVITGSITEEELDSALNDIVSLVPRRRTSQCYVPSEPRQLTRRDVHIPQEVNLYRGIIGYKVPGMRHEDAPALDMLSMCLGGGYSSLLWRRLREELNLVHYVDCSSWNPGEVGLFYISYLCDPGKEAEVESEIENILASVSSEGFDKELMDKAIRQLVVSVINGRKTVSGVAGKIAMSEIVLGEGNYDRRYFEQLSKLNVKSVSSLIAKYLVEDQMTRVTLGPIEKIEAPQINSKGKSGSGFEKIELSNNVRILFEEDRSLPKVHFGLYSLSGPCFEPKGQRGISGMLATLLTKDTANRDAQEISSILESHGASFYESVGNNTLSLSMETMSDDWRMGFNLLQESLWDMKISQSTLDIERSGKIASLKESDDDVLEFGNKHLREYFFGEHPYSVNSLGLEHDLVSLDIKALNTFKESIVCGSNLVLTVTGAMDKQSVMDEIVPVLETLPDQKIDSSVMHRKIESGSGTYTVEMDKEQAVVFQAFPSTGATKDDFIVTTVLEELTNGLSSNLFNRVREDKGLAYYVGSSSVMGLSGGMFYLYAGTLDEQREQVFSEFDAEITQFVKGKVDSTDLQNCKNRLKVQRRNYLQTIGGRALKAGLDELYDLRVRGLVEYECKLDEVTVESIQSYAEQFLNLDNCLRLSVVPKKSS